MNLDSLQFINLLGCTNLSQETAKLLISLEVKHELQQNNNFQIEWPRHLNQDQNVVQAKESIKRAYQEYCNFGLSDNELVKSPTYHLFHRLLNENLDQRGQRAVIFLEGLQVAKIIEQHSYLLEVFDQIASYHTQDCVNQPVFGFLRIATLASASAESDIQMKLAIIKRIAVIHAIEQSVLILKNSENQSVGIRVQVELGNAMIREVCSRLKE